MQQNPYFNKNNTAANSRYQIRPSVIRMDPLDVHFQDQRSFSGFSPAKAWSLSPQAPPAAAQLHQSGFGQAATSERGNAASLFEAPVFNALHPQSSSKIGTFASPSGRALSAAPSPSGPSFKSLIPFDNAYWKKNCPKSSAPALMGRLSSNHEVQKVHTYICQMMFGKMSLEEGLSKLSDCPPEFFYHASLSHGSTPLHDVFFLHRAKVMNGEEGYCDNVEEAQSALVDLIMSKISELGDEAVLKFLAQFNSRGVTGQNDAYSVRFKTSEEFRCKTYTRLLDAMMKGPYNEDSRGWLWGDCNRLPYAKEWVSPNPGIFELYFYTKHTGDVDRFVKCIKRFTASPLEALALLTQAEAVGGRSVLELFASGMGGNDAAKPGLQKFFNELVMALPDNRPEKKYLFEVINPPPAPKLQR